MGRLFWKFFVSIWLAQAAAVVVITGGMWIKDHSFARSREQVDFGPSAAFMVDGAVMTLRYGGINALRALLEDPGNRPVYAVNRNGDELLGRPLDRAIVEELRQLHADEDGLHSVQEVHLLGGQTWLLFTPRRAGYEGGPHSDGEWEPHSPPGSHGGPPHPDRFPLLPILFALVASVLSAAVLAWQFARPIRRLRAAFEEAAAGKLDVRIGDDMGKRRDELTKLGRDFDRMAERLQLLVDGQRRLLHDVSHEMRSPLARLQAATGLARQKPERVDASLDRIELECTRMDRLVGELLTLSRIEAGVPGAMEEAVNLGEVIGDIVKDASFEAQADGKTVSFNDENSATVRGNAELLHSAIENVVRNAIKHTAAGTTVKIGVETDIRAVNAVIRVCDQGAGVPETELELIFRPFHRGSQGVEVPGHGLGLAIAHRVVQAHQGGIRAYNLAAGGLCVEMCIPLAAG